MELDPSESINNMGKLRVDVLDAMDLPSADRNGKSDPYCKFELNGQEVYKTKVQKKTLRPAWNEFFECSVPSRTAAKFHVTVYDWDFADKPDYLGGADINLESLDPFQASESRYILDGKSGTIRLRLLFRPDYVTRMKHGTSTFSGTFAAPGRIVTGVAGVPLKGGVAVAGAVGQGVGKGATFLRRGVFGKKGHADEVPAVTEEVTEMPTLQTNGTDVSSSADGSPGPATALAESGGAAVMAASNSTESPGHGRAKSMTGSSIHSGVAGSGPAGSASFTVVSASGFPPSSNLYISISQTSPREKTIGKTKHHKARDGQWTFGETFTAKCAADAQFKVEARGEHTFGSDDSLGQHVYFVDDSGSGQEKELPVGSGTVVVKSTFQGAESSLSAESPRSTLRRSLLSKREARGSRESTPA